MLLLSKQHLSLKVNIGSPVGVVVEEGHAYVAEHSACHGDCGTFYQIEGRNAAHTGRYYDNRSNR